MIKLIHKIIFVFFIFFSIEVKSKEVGIGDVNSKITIKVFSSLTCPACANFHSKIFYQIKEEFIDKGLVRFEHHPFPLDLAALNAEMIVRCEGSHFGVAGDGIPFPYHFRTISLPFPYRLLHEQK